METLHLWRAVVGCVLCGSLTLSATPAYALTTYDIITIGPTDAGHTRSTDNYRNSWTQYLNDAGQAVGYADRYTGATSAGISVWLYNGTSALEIGLTDAGHTNNVGYQYNQAQSLNNAGQAVGYAERYTGATFTGYSAWLYNGTSTLEIGLTDAGHTSSYGYQYNQAQSLNNAGQAVGYADRYDGAYSRGRSAWLYNGTSALEIGLTDAGHTNNVGYQYNQAQSLNEAGQVLGGGSRFTGATSAGKSAWLYNGTSTLEIGLTDAGHTRSTDDYQFNDPWSLNEAGQAVGYAYRYTGATFTGYSAWLYNGTSALEIGLTDAGHTRSTDGLQYNWAWFLNGAGQALGEANRYTGTTSTGISAWLYNGTSTLEIGLTDAGHTRSTDDYQTNKVLSLSDAGQALGRAERYTGATSTGYSAWLYDGTSTLEIGLTDAGHTSSSGYQYNYAQFLNEAGQMVGYAERYTGAVPAGRTAWFYDATIDQTYSMDWSVRSTDGYAESQFSYLGDDGLGLGVYNLFDAGGASLGLRAFSFTEEGGFLDLGSLVDGGLTDAGWLYLANAIRANSAGQISGGGLLDDMTSGQVAYLLTTRAASDLVIDFGAIGLWARMNDASWLKLNNSSADQVVVGDMDGNGEDDVIAAFGSGIYVKRNLGPWAQLHNFVPELMAVGDLDNNGKDDVVIDFGGIGLWARMNDASWLKLNNTSPDQVVVGDLDGNGADDVIAVYSRRDLRETQSGWLERSFTTMFRRTWR